MKLFITLVLWLEQVSSSAVRIKFPYRYTFRKETLVKLRVTPLIFLSIHLFLSSESKVLYLLLHFMTATAFSFLFSFPKPFTRHYIDWHASFLHRIFRRPLASKCILGRPFSMPSICSPFNFTAAFIHRSFNGRRGGLKLLPNEAESAIQKCSLMSIKRSLVRLERH